MSQYFSVHPSHPQRRLLARAADIVAGGGVVVYPTDTAYALGCHIGDKQSLDRIRQIRRLGDKHHFTLVCRDLSEISVYAKVSDANYRILKHLTPGPFTFVLAATREVPRRLVHPKRKTIGLRIPDNAVALELLELLGEPMMTTTLRFPDQEVPYTDPEDLRTRLERSVDLIIDGGHGEIEPTTVVDLTGSVPEVRRQGLGVFE
ncbi:MAG: L-threonylcarbamoyladenylate synthase [Gammaproteobacteria bacterium]|nr:L-threonylcarbamoyladenylate synthase [Gammaproteobacteria bacterium]